MNDVALGCSLPSGDKLGGEALALGDLGSSSHGALSGLMLAAGDDDD